MRENALERQRRWVGRALLVGAGLGAVWFFSPGLPVIFGPWASAATKQAGQELFVREWAVNDPLAHGDGVGPVFNARSCVTCHFQGGVGGGGSLAQNIRNYEVVPNTRDREGAAGTVHNFAVAAQFKESIDQVRRRYPIIKGGRQTVVSEGCSYTRVIQDVDPVRLTTLQPTALFGAGWIDRISAKAISNNFMSQGVANLGKEFHLDFSSVPAGRVRVLPDGRVGKFGWKAQFATLEEFVAAACANELGLGTPLREQVKPFGHDGYTAPPDLDRKQFKALVAFVDTLPRPAEVPPAEPAKRESAAHGKELFTSVGCAVCHTPEIGGVAGVYSDFVLHTVDDLSSAGGGGYGADVSPEVPLPEDRPKDSEWRTPPLWGVADSAPYLHDGSAATLHDAVLRHGADAKLVRDAYKKLTPADQGALIAFLGTLRAPPTAAPVADTTALAANQKR
jgi:mono/diheme cytochrome c family protein